MWRLVFIALGLLALGSARATAQTARPLVAVRVAVNPQQYSFLPFELAVDKGYFAAEGLDLKITTYSGSAVALMPLVARGDLDIAPQVAGPALFNQRQQGFDARIVCSINEPQAGWASDTWVMVRKDLWDAGTVRSLKDLRGRAIGGGPDGGTGGFILDQALAKAGLSRGDVQYSTRLNSIPDLYAAMQNKAEDVIPLAEPMATELETHGIGKKLASVLDVAPWMQEAVFVSSETYIHDHPTVVAGFIKAYLRGAREVTASRGKWTPELVSVTAKWTGLSAGDVNKLNGPTYVGQLGAIDPASLDREQDYFAKLGLVKTKVDVRALIDDGPLRAARKALKL